jgi:hypothetical protein
MQFDGTTKLHRKSGFGLHQLRNRYRPKSSSRIRLTKTLHGSGDGLAVFGVVDVDQPPLPGFSSVDLGFDAMRGHGRSVFPHRRMKNPVEFRPPRVAVHVDRYTVRLKIACREHAAHYVLKDLLLDGIEAVLLAQSNGPAPPPFA